MITYVGYGEYMIDFVLFSIHWSRLELDGKKIFMWAIKKNGKIIFRRHKKIL